MINKVDKNVRRLRKHRRVRGKITGVPECPRLCVFRSLKHIYAQIIDDTKGHTIVSASSSEKDFSLNGGNKEGAHAVGNMIADRALSAGISCVVFDRGGYLYHGRVKELADGAREKGLRF